MGFFSFHHKYIHTHKVVTECVINTLSVSIYTHIYIYNQIWEPEDDLVKVCFEKAGGLFVREREILFFFFFLFFSSLYV